MPTFNQVGLILSMLHGCYDGDVDFKTLATYGDMGLGTINGINGEMIAVDGKFYCVDAKGVARQVAPSEQTPFAVMSKAEPTITFTTGHVSVIDTFNALLDEHLPSLNIFYMLRIDAEIEWVKLRSESCQVAPYKPLMETLPSLQTLFELENIKGTIISSRCPAYSATFTVPGFHHHLIDENKTTGGHVFNLRIKNSTVNVTVMRKLNLHLFNTQNFDEMDLAAEVDLHGAIEKLEKAK